MQVAVETVIAWQEYSGAPNTRDEALAILGARCAGSDKHEVVRALDGVAESLSAATSRLPAQVKKHRFEVQPASAAESIVDFVVSWHWER